MQNIAMFVEDKQLVNVKPFVGILVKSLIAEKLFEKEVTQEIKDFLQCFNDCIVISKNRAESLAKTLINSIIVCNKWKVSDNFKKLINSILEGKQAEENNNSQIVDLIAETAEKISEIVNNTSKIEDAEIVEVDDKQSEPAITNETLAAYAANAAFINPMSIGQQFVDKCQCGHQHMQQQPQQNLEYLTCCNFVDKNYLSVLKTNDTEEINKVTRRLNEVFSNQGIINEIAKHYRENLFKVTGYDKNSNRINLVAMNSNLSYVYVYINSDNVKIGSRHIGGFNK